MVSWEEAQRRVEVLRRGTNESQREWVKRCARALDEWQRADRSRLEVDVVVEPATPAPSGLLPDGS